MIKLMCPNCYKITQMDIDRWNNDYGKCDECKQGDKVHIDDNMVDLIVDLNNKGYKTQFCCEGHIDNPISLNTYIMIEGYIDMPYIPEKFDISLRNDIGIGERTCIRGELHLTSICDEITEEIRDLRRKIKENNLKEMRKIVDSLPDRSIE